MTDRNNIVKYIRFLYDKNTSTSRDKIDILLDNLTEDTLDTVIEEISEHLEPYLEQAIGMTERRIEKHAEQLPDGNEYKKAVKEAKDKKPKK